MQMTGLNSEQDKIISISCFVTNAQLELADLHGWDTIIHHDKTTLDGMDGWCVQTHGNSGLTAASIASTTTPQQASDGLLEYVQRFVPRSRMGLLAGNSVHCDKEFLRKPPYNQVLDYLNYRIFDVSSIKEAARRWAPRETLKEVPVKKGLHQARDDILESIEEARFYRKQFFLEKK